ncbi:MAG: prepilin-type N-terminal cleavage/methylation domain-containing protein [Phycisphaerales bacterium]|nr:prepilin-type N-terminal cleavage/methylation domain-containing protein [Phycisphaerales bacterium]
MTPGPRHRGFTLVELILAAMITALIAGATATALGQMSRARAASVAHQEAFSAAQAAADRIALDVLTAARDEDLAFCRVAVTDGGAPGAESDSILLLTRSLRRVRGLVESPEGADFEVQYRLLDGTLWRRCDPALDDYPDAGGVAAPVAEGIASLSIEACDRENWVASWDSDSDGLPYGVRIIVTARDSEGRATAVVRKVVPLDRVPPPPETADEDESAPPPAEGTP